MSSIANGLSYDYANLVRDMMTEFEQLRVSYPTLLSLIPLGAGATSTKVEWLEDSVSPVSTTIGSFDTDGDGTGVNVVSTAGMRAGAILRFSTSADVSRTEQCKIATVDSATDLTLVRDYGSRTTGETLVVGDKVYLTSSPLNEKTDPGSANGQEPDVAFNYTQIFERMADISKTAQAIQIYGLSDALNYQAANKMVEIQRELNSAVIYGRKVERSSSENGTMGGILQYMESGNAETTGGAISEAIINNMLEDIFQDGSVTNNFALLCAENQARKISALNTSGTNPVVMKQPSDQNLGGYISSFTGDLPVLQGFQAKRAVDPNFEKDKVAILDLNKVELAWLRPIQDEDATLPGADKFARRILGEVSLRVKNGQQAHAVATGLTVENK